MKKFSISACAYLILANFALANTDFNKTLSDTLENGLDEKKIVKILSVDDLKTLNGFKFVITDINDELVALFVSSDGKNAFNLSNIALINDENDKKLINDKIENFKEKQKAKQEKIAYEIIKTIPKERFIHINSFDKNNKFITYMITDPECPYCIKEMSKIVKWLRNANVKIIFAPVHGKSAYTKSAIMLKEASKIDPDNQQEIIKILDKYYDMDVNVTDNDATDDERSAILDDAKKIFSKGVVKGVPFSFTVDK